LQSSRPARASCCGPSSAAQNKRTMGRAVLLLLVIVPAARAQLGGSNPEPNGLASLTCPTGSNYVGPDYPPDATNGAAAPTQGPVACIDTSAVAYRATLQSSDAAIHRSTVELYGETAPRASSAAECGRWGRVLKRASTSMTFARGSTCDLRRTVRRHRHVSRRPTDDPRRLRYVHTGAHSAIPIYGMRRQYDQHSGHVRRPRSELLCASRAGLGRGARSHGGAMGQ
jgi:hypothetical protein